MQESKISNRLVILLFFVVFIQQLTAQHNVFRPLTMDNGLSNFVVTALYKDSIGFMWIGTDNSLDRFDGVDFRHYYFQSGDINKKRVRCITETNSGELYVANGLGLWKLNRSEDKLELVHSEEINCGVAAIKWNSREKKLYVGSNKGLFIVDKNDNLSFIPLDKNVLSNANYIMGMVLDNDNNLWITTKKGLIEFNKSTQKFTTYENKTDEGEQTFMSKLTCVGKTLYIGTSKSGILCFDIDKLQFYKTLDVGSDIITDISSDGKNTVYVATDGNGVHFISHADKKLIKTIRYEPKQLTGIRSNSVYSLLVDRDGIMWTGYYQAGLDYSLYRNPVFNTYNFLPYFDSEGLPVRTLLINENDKLIGTREGLYFIREKDKIVKSFKKETLRSNLILSLSNYKGEYYIGTYGGGVSVLNPYNFSIRQLKNDYTLSKGHVFHFEQDADGNLWLATSGGLYRYNKDKNELISFTNSNSQLLAGNVFYIFFDSSKKGWIATENGLCIYDPSTKSIKSDIFPREFFNKEIIKVIHEDSKHRLFFCPDKGNIYVSDLNMTKFSAFKPTKRFKERVFMSVVEDMNHNYWFGSDNGLISLKEGQDNYSGYGFMDGIPDAVFNADAAFMEKNGKLWFGNAKGLLWIDPRSLNGRKKESTNKKIAFTDFEINGSKIPTDKFEDLIKSGKITLDYNENKLKIRFVSLVYTSPSTIVYEYRLKGHDEDWQILTAGQNEISYTDLPAGKYEFLVRTEGDPSTQNQLIIKIHSFFSYKFWLIVGLLALAIYFMANKLMRLLRSLRNKIAQLSSENKQKSEKKYEFAKISEVESKSIYERLITYIETEKPYINPDLKIVDLADAIKCSSHSLSFIFNQYLEKSYYDFINEYRILEFKRIISETDSSKYTLSALADQCGFSSRASFFRSFKKLTGITPNEYIRSVGKSVNPADLADEN